MTTTVTLEEVIAAAGGRRAALAPETSGYFALAIGDATSRLPLRMEDRAISLTMEGTVMVPRKGDLVPPADAARTLRDVLARLLAVSAGSMPGLTQAARPRNEENVDGVVAGIEAALIPVNRAAARRALARLARETVRAKNAGKLRGLRAMASLSGAPSSRGSIAGAESSSSRGSIAGAESSSSRGSIAGAASSARGSISGTESSSSRGSIAGAARSRFDSIAPAEAPKTTAALAPPRPTEPEHATNGGAEAVFEASDTPQPYAPGAACESAPVTLEPASPIEAAPVEPIAAIPEAVETSASRSIDEPAPAIEARSSGATATGGEAGGNDTAIEAAAVVSVDAQDDADPVPPSRETTPTLMGVGDVGVYVAKAVENAIAAVGHARAKEVIASADRTAPWPCVMLDDVAPVALSAAEPDPSGDREPFDSPESIAGDLGDVPVAPVTSPDRDDDDTTLAIPLVATTKRTTESSFEAVRSALSEIARAPRILPEIGAFSGTRERPVDPRARAEQPTIPGSARARGRADLAPTDPSSVDDLLTRFNVAGMRDERRVAQTLKTFAGLETTAAPPVVWESPRPEGAQVSAPPSAPRTWESSPVPPSTRPARAARMRVLVSTAIVAFGLVGTGTIWRLRSEIFHAPRLAATGAPVRPTPPPIPSEEPHADFDP